MLLSDEILEDRYHVNLRHLQSTSTELGGGGGVWGVL